MAKQIQFIFDGKEYTLEYTRKSVKQVEAEGFDINNVTKAPMTYIPILFAGAFKAHHKWVKPDVVDEIYDNMPDKDKLLERLVEMYNDTLVTLMDDPKEDSAKKVKWMTNW